MPQQGKAEHIYRIIERLADFPLDAMIATITWQMRKTIDNEIIEDLSTHDSRQ